MAAPGRIPARSPDGCGLSLKCVTRACHIVPASRHDVRPANRSRCGTYVAEPKTLDGCWQVSTRPQRSVGVGDRHQGPFRLREVQRFGTTKGDVMGQQSIGQWPERSELDPRGSVTVDCVDAVHWAGICLSRVCHDGKTGRAQPSRREIQGEQRDDAHPPNPVTAHQTWEKR